MAFHPFSIPPHLGAGGRRFKSSRPDHIKQGLMASAVSPFCFGLALGLAFGGKIFQYLQLFAEKWPFFDYH